MKELFPIKTNFVRNGCSIFICTLDATLLTKIKFYVHVASGMLGFLNVIWTMNLNSLGSLVMGTSTWSLHFLSPEYFKLHALLQDADGAVGS